MACNSRPQAHTTACGLKPYDYDSGILGPQKCTEGSNWSPFPRINKIRKHYQSCNYNMDTTRLRAITEVYKENESLSPCMKKALLFQRLVNEYSLRYLEGDLFPLDAGVPILGMNVYPEQYRWVFDECADDRLRTRSYLPYKYSDEVRDEVMSYADYWNGKSIAETFRARLPRDTAMGCAIAGGLMVINSNVHVEQAVGHATPYYERILDMGWGGLKKYVLEHMEKLGCPDTEEKLKAKELYDAQLIVLDAIGVYFRRYAKFLEEQIANYSDQQIKDELKTMSEMYEHLAEGTPRTFWEAATLVFAAVQMIWIESGQTTIGMGRMDYYLAPYYKTDIENGILTKAFAQELLDCFYLHIDIGNAAQYPTNDLYRFGQKGSWGAQVMVGGIDSDGNDITNDLSFMLLDATGHTRQAVPFTSVRYHDGTPYELKVKVAEVMRLGTGHPKIMNDRVAMDALERMGCAKEDVWNYCNIGCTEMMIAGKNGGWVDVGGVNLPKILELALNNGRCFDCGGEACPNYKDCRGAGKSLGLETGYLKDFKTFDEVIAAYEAQMKYWADRMAVMTNVLQMVYAECDDWPYMSLLFDGCVESGVSWINGGATYNHAGVQALGPATVADSLTALKKHVYEDKTHTAEEFYDALCKNWEGHERLYQLVNSEKTPHFGNDDDYADAMMVYVLDHYADLYQSLPPSRGKWKFVTGSFSSIVNVMYGLFAGATPDGRKHHEVISANIESARTVVSHRDLSGPTAYARSIGKIDHRKFSTGTLINLKFGTETVAGDVGRQNLVDYLDAYFDQNPLHVQVMITDRDTLLAARAHPEEYQDLIVRVSGFSSYFHSLSEEFQDELINRTEHIL